MDELRQTELTALRDTHTEHMNNLVDQLRETEAEVLSLREKLQETEAQKKLSPTPPPLTFRPSTNDTRVEPSPSPVPDRGTKRQRSMKKRKQKALMGSHAEVTELSRTAPEPPVEKTFNEMAVQCVMLDFSTDTSTDFEKVDPPSSGVHTPKSDTAQIMGNGHTTDNTVGVQHETETVDTETQTDLARDLAPELKPKQLSMTETVGVQTLTPLDESNTGESLIGVSVSLADDVRSQVSDISDISSSSRYLDDLVHQLAEEVQSYELVVDEVVHTVTKRFSPRSEQLGNVEVNEDEIAQKLSMFQNSLKQRRDRLAAIRKKNHKRALKSGGALPIDREVSALSTSAVMCSRSSSPVIPSTETSVIVDPVDVYEPESDGWREGDGENDNDFFGLHSTHTQVLKSASSISSHGDDKKAQTLHRSESSETVVSDLRNTIQQLETRLSMDAEAYENQLEALKHNLKPTERLRNLLSQAVQHLVSTLPGPPPLPPGSPSLSVKESSPPLPRDWPPTDPEAQLAMIIGLERAASEQVRRLRVALDNTKEALDSVSQENAELQQKLDDYRSNEISQPTPSSEVSLQDKTGETADIARSREDEMSSVAYRLCLALDPDYSAQVWDPDQWDFLLYDLLKSRFDESVEDVSPNQAAASDERVIQLTAEVAALRDILGQHTAFRTQAERDLRRLLTTVTSQRAQIDELTAQKDQLQQDLTQSRQQVEQPVLLNRQDESDELSRTAIRQLSELVREKEEEVERLQRRCDDLTQLIRSAHNRTTVSDPANTASVDEDVTVVLERLTEQLSEAKSRADRTEAMYESVLSALEQKHAESQAYHMELQRVYTDLNASNDRSEALNQELAEMRQKLLDVQSESLTLRAHRPEHDANETEVIHTDTVPVTAVSATGVTDTSESNVHAVEHKLMAEVERLRAHLLEMEESYNMEALNAEAREVDLRNQLHDAQKRLTEMEECSRTAEDRVRQAYTERDEARRMSEVHQKEIIALEANLTNLQSVLDSFQQNQQSAVTAETEHMRLELHRVRQNEASLRSELDDLSGQLADQNQLKEHNRQLSSQIQRHTAQLDRIRAQINEKDAQIDSLRTRLAQMAVDTDSKIDKVLMKNLLLSYFQLPGSQKQNGLRVIGSLLHFTDEEYAKAGSNSGAIPTLLNWMRVAVSSLPSGPPRDVTFASSYPDKSFTELFLSFLEQEAGLRAPLKLSMDHYTPEAVKPSTSRRPSQPTEELEDVQLHSWSHSVQTSTPPISMRVPDTVLSQSTSGRVSKSPAPLNPLFQM
ncbi:hypothetical protein FGIG_04717 [Fasciola gigantica]|uniref:GRIP domain-containing protein n=1 Tax=Fasciola gigantica TaxID=46835 RepID=A0A504XTE9_FASGI|nr:hypothetical protein FGIG_04717 [Fasciola gigantica]